LPVRSSWAVFIGKYPIGIAVGSEGKTVLVGDEIQHG